MQPRNPGIEAPRRRLAGAPIAAILLAALTASCASNSGGSGGSSGGLFGLFGPGDSARKAEGQDYDPSFFLKTGYCPPAEIRGGTEALITYERGHEGEAAFIRTQGSVSKLARECSGTGDTIAIKIGVAGRVVAGPRGGPGPVTLPLRIAVIKQHGGNVFFSQVYPIQVNLAAPEFAADYAQVYEQVVIKVSPDDRDLVVYVGFDEGKPKPKAGA